MNFRDQWWKSEDPEMAIFGTLDQLESQVEYRSLQYRDLLSMYENKSVGDLNPFEYMNDHGMTKGLGIGGEQVATVNASASCLDTLAARIASQEPRTQFLTSTDGTNSWEIKQRAKKLEKAVAGIFYKKEIYPETVKVFFDAGIFGVGFLKVFEDEGEVCAERVPPFEIIVDESAAMTSTPRSLFQTKWVPYEVLTEMFSDEDAKDAIALAVGYDQRSIDGEVVTTDLIKVIEAWHLKSGKKGKDGKHVICIKGHTLLEEEYTEDDYPFILFHWQDPIVGFYPQGLMSRAQPLQKQSNKLLLRVQQAMHLYSTANTYYEAGSIEEQHLKNTMGNLVPYRAGSGPPQVHMPNSISNELITHIRWLLSSIFETAGVSQMSAMSVKPVGIESGVALRTLNDTESGRFALLNKRWDKFFIKITQHIIEVCRGIYSGNQNYAVNYSGKGVMESIKWTDVDMDRDCYELQIFPSNMLPHTPAGRLATVEEMMEANLIDPKEGLSLLGFPDLEQYQSLSTAALEDIDHQIGEMLSKGVYVSPEPFQDLEVGVKRVTSALLRARQDGAPEERQNLLLDWLDEAMSLVNPPPEAAPPMPPGMELPPKMGPPPPGAEGLPPKMMGPPPGPPLPPEMGPPQEGGGELPPEIEALLAQEGGE